MAELTILGGGPAGLGVAFYAHKAGHCFTLYEKSAELGGMCRTFRHGEHRYDAGAHRLHDRDQEITRDLQELMGGGLQSVKAPSKLWNRGKFIDFPPTPLNAALSFGMLGAGRIAFEVLRARWRAQPCVNFGDFARQQFGETLAQRLLIDYSEKLWGLPADQLSPDIATRRLSGMSLSSLILELLSPSRKTRHIDGDFLYPRQGYGAIAERLAASLPEASLATGYDVARLETRKGAIERLHFGDGRTAGVGDRVVSTLPLTLLVKLLGDALPQTIRDAAARLRFRRLRLVFLRLGIPRVSDNASIYVPGPEFKVSRVYEPKIRSADMAPDNETSLVVEIPCFAGDETAAMTDEALTERVIGELDQIGVVGRQHVLEWRHHVLPFAYPVYSLGYEREVAAIVEGLSSIANLDLIGRAGSFFYSHLHDQLRMGKDYVGALATAGRRSPAPQEEGGTETVGGVVLASR